MQQPLGEPLEGPSQTPIFAGVGLLSGANSPFPGIPPRDKGEIPLGVYI